MGMYDTYEGVQCKVGFCTDEEYHIGDDVPMKEGVFQGHKGFIVIKDHVLVAVVEIKGVNTER